MNYLIKYIKYLVSLLGLLVLFSCSQYEDNDSPFVDEENNTRATAESTILIYAVATNSLSGNLVSDKNEMVAAASEIDLDKNNVLIFQTVYQYDSISKGYVGNVSLIELIKDGAYYGWNTVKEYSNETASLNPQRINEVIKEVVNSYPAENYGLIFWSHSTGSQPFVSTKSVENLPALYSFGQDKTTMEPQYEQINVEDLSSSLPDNLFDFIWFDSCYMSNIESIYQFRGKCNTFVGYPTEVLEYGLPYDIVLPILVGRHPDLILAADTFFRYYAENPYSSLRLATIAVTDMNKIENLADYCRSIYMAGTNVTINSSIHKYTRGTTGPFYDLGDYSKAIAYKNGIELSDEEWNYVVNDCIIYKNSTPYDFVGVVDPERYSGISTHIYNFPNSEDDLGYQDNSTELYYKSLDWFKAVF